MITTVPRAPSCTRLPNTIVHHLLRLGVPLGPMWLLTVRGRRSGQPRTTPVGLFDYGGRRYLFGTFGATNWVRNVRAAGEVTMSRGRRRETFAAAELTPEQAAPFLKDVIAPNLKNPVAALVLRGRFDVPLGAPVADFVAEGRRHPVFELHESSEPV